MYSYDQKIQTDIAVHLTLYLTNVCWANWNTTAIRGNVKEWIQSFLFDRQMWVAVDGEVLSKCRVDSGVPQGTILGPLLFLSFVSDLPYQISDIAHLFADDCLSYREIRSEEDQQIFQRDLEALNIWATKWGSEV